jgi:predicted AlkP superfamily pyrophosphatase or phosphodiesterase
MTRRAHWLVALLLVCLGTGSVQAREPLLLIGIDGLRWDIIDRHPAPVLRALAAAGVRSQGLVPVMPSKTFPNFYAIATGLYPENNGVLDNASYDEVLDKSFRMSDQDDARWFEGEPIWITAERQGLATATMFWVGSGVEIDGLRPRYWHPFDGSVNNAARVRQVLDWFALAEAERPAFVSVYFEAIDTASHEFGVDSPQEREAVAAVDASIGEMLAGIEALGLHEQLNVMVVGDHGMTNLDAQRIVYLDDYLDVSSLSSLYSPQLSGERQGNAVFAAWHGAPDQIETLYQALALAHPALSVYRQAQFPEWFHQRHPQRAPDLILMPEPGWMVSKRAVPYSGPRANHGFSPLERDMHASFIASGPAFLSAQVVEPFELVHLYNLMARLLDIEPAPNDGDPARILPLLAPGR